MTATCRPTNAAAGADNRSLRPSVQAYSMVRVRPSMKPASASPLRSALTRNSDPAAVESRRNPTTGIAERARRERPCGCHAAEKREEFATFQLIELHSAPASQG